MWFLKYLYEDVLIWLIFAVVGCIGWIGTSVFLSLASSDPSAGAWIGFLPLIAPMFLMYSIGVSLIAMCVYKATYYLLKTFL